MRSRVVSFVSAWTLLVASSACIIIPIPSGGGGSSDPPTGPVELRSDCARTVSLFVGDQPGADAPKTPLAPKGRTTIARRRDGSATVWIFDETGELVGSAQMAPETRKATLDKSCTVIAVR